jgi:cell division protein FtsB
MPAAARFRTFPPSVAEPASLAAVDAGSRAVLRWLALGMLGLVIALHARLWGSSGGMPEVWRLEARVAAQAEENRRLEARNSALAADVADLKEGREAVEERARAELGMVRPAEVFYQVIEKPAASGGKAGENPDR